jgi:hypothetical protein
LKHRAFNDEPALFIWVCEAKNSNAEVDYVLQVGPRIVYASVVVGEGDVSRTKIG